MECIQKLMEMVQSGQVDPQMPIGQFIEMAMAQQAPAEGPGLGSVPQAPMPPQG